MDGIDPNTLAQYPLLVIVLGTCAWGLKFFRNVLLEIVEKHAETEIKMSESLDQNTTTLTNLDKTLTVTSTQITNAIDNLK